MSFFRRLFGFWDKKTVTEAPLPASPPPSLVDSNKVTIEAPPFSEAAESKKEGQDEANVPASVETDIEAAFARMQSDLTVYRPPTEWLRYPRSLAQQKRFDQALAACEWIVAHAEDIAMQNPYAQDIPPELRRGEAHHYRRMTYECMQRFCKRAKQTESAQKYATLGEESAAAYEKHCALRETHTRQEIKQGRDTPSALGFAIGETELKLYALAAQQILAGSRLPESMWLDLSLACRGGWGSASLKRMLGEGDFDWPWYDHWKQIFDARQRYPGSIFRYDWEDLNDPIPPCYENIEQVLLDMSVSELRGVAKAKTIPLAGASKKDAIREAIAPKIQWLDVETWAMEKNREHVEQTRKGRIRAKQSLLSMSLALRYDNLYRHAQIADLLSERPLRRRTAHLKYGVHGHVMDNENRWILREFFSDWKFSPEDNTNLPPFFPGDCSCIETKRG
jgi:hypothetical protein